MKKIVIQNARLVNGISKDILIENGIIKKVSPSLDIDENTIVVALDDECYVSPGWIDIHTHCFHKFEIYADDCEAIGYKKGVTRVVDAGTAGADNITEFYKSVENCKTHVYSLLNISKTGIYAQNELADMSHIDSQAFMEAYKKYPDFIVGVKARISKSVIGDNGDQPLLEAIKIANQVDLPLMIHIGTAPSSLQTVMSHMRKGDIVTHIFNPKSNGIVEHNGIKDCVLEAYQRGVYFDLGHGTDSFSFHSLDIANQHQIKVHSISSDIYHRNRENGPVFDLATTMSKLYNRGYDLKDIIDCVTINPATMLRLKNLGKIEEGYCGELTIFKIIKEKKSLIDSLGVKIIVKEYIEPIAVVLNNEYINLKGVNSHECL